MNLTEGLRSKILKTLMFLGLPLLLELVAYLIRSDIYPGYLPIPAQITNILLVFLYYGLFYAAVSLLFAILFTFLRLRVETSALCILFAAFLALTLSRLLPHDSGFSPFRILVFSVSLILSAGLFYFLKVRNFSASRLLVATSFYCLAAAYLLPHLFQFPVTNVFYALGVHVIFISLLLLVPGKILAGLVVFVVVVLFQSKTPLPYFASPNKLPVYDRVIIVGIDGLSPEVTFEMARQGKMPAVRKMMENGVFGRLHTLSVPFSPLVWNTIYTGTEPQQHGIMAFTFTGVAGGRPYLSLWLDNWTNSDWMHRATGILKYMRAIPTLNPSLSKNRLRPALWNIVNQNDASAIVLGGWTTYPPERIRGLYVSDYALTRSSDFLGAYYPVNKQVDDLLAFQPDVSSWPDDLQRYLLKDEKTHYLWQNLKDGLAIHTRLIATYYYSTDAFGHHYGTFLDRKATPVADRSKDVELEERIYRNIDRYLQSYLDQTNDRTLLIVCSDHGFHYDKRQHNYPVDGTILMMGNGVRKAALIEASVYNIAPTITYALGIGPDILFHGLPLRLAFNGIITEAESRKYTPNKEFFEVSNDKGFEREKLQELLDLQYINK